MAYELISFLHGETGIPTTLLAVKHGRASTNTVAKATVKVLHPDIFDVACFSRTLDHVGE